MPRKKEDDDFLNKIYVKYVVAPVIVIMGMMIVGSLLDGALHTKDTFSVIFAVMGGVGIIGSYFSKFWKHGK
jgi:hypothetical protein